MIARFKIFGLTFIYCNILCCITAIAQTKADSLNNIAYNFYHKERNFVEAKKYYLKSVELYKQQAQYTQAILNSYNAHRSSTRLMEPLDEAKQILLNALEFVNEDNKNSKEVAILYSGLGTIYNRIYQYDNSQYYLNKALEIFPNVDWQSSKEHYYDALIYSGLNDLELYNYSKAELAIDKAFEFSQKNNLDSSHALNHKIRLTALTKNIEDLNSIINTPANRKIIEDAPLFNYFDIINEIINVYRDQGNFKKALEYQNQLTKRIESSPFKVHFSGRFTAMAYAAIYHEMGKYNKAIETLKANDDDQSRQLKPSEAAMCDLMIAESYLELNDFDSASVYLEKSLGYNSSTFYKTDLSYNFDIIDDSLLEKLAILGEYFNKQNKEKKDPELLDKIISVYEIAHQVLLEVCKTSEEDNLITQENYKYLYGNLLNSYWQKWNATSNSEVFYNALNYADESKQVAIASELKSVKLDKLFKNKIDSKLLIEESRLNRKIDSLNRLLSFASKQPTQQQLNKTIQEFRNFKIKLKEAHPKYYKYKYGGEVPVQDILNRHYKEDNVIEFFEGDSTIYVFRVYKNQLNFDKIALTQELQQNINTFIINSSGLGNKDFKTSGNFIFQNLFKNYLVDNAKNVVILDGTLQKLPIEALIIKDKKESKFLIASYNVLRGISIKHNIIETSKKEEQYPSLIFAPFASQGTKTNYKLPSSVEEVEFISNLFKSTIYVDKEASKTNFINSVSSQKLVHLATHSEVNSTNPKFSKIYFYTTKNTLPQNGYLTLDEVYNLSLNADLVTLSSCETGIGKEIKGRGVMSFANALTFAGAKSTVMSLWKVPDNNTTLIMRWFYENLNKGLHKDEALRKAKLTYLNTVEDNNLKHPYYWAGFVISGDTTPIVTSLSNKLWYVLGIMAVIILFGLFYKRFRKL